MKKVLADFLKKSPVPLGDLVKHINTFIDKAYPYPDGSMQLMLRTYFDNKVDFAIRAPVPYSKDTPSLCGPFAKDTLKYLNAAKEFYDIVTKVNTDLSNTIRNTLDPIIKRFEEFWNLLNVVCYPKHLYYMQLEVKRDELKKDKTCLDIAPSKVTLLGKETSSICMDIIPTVSPISC